MCPLASTASIGQHKHRDSRRSSAPTNVADGTRGFETRLRAMLPVNPGKLRYGSRPPSIANSRVADLRATLDRPRPSLGESLHRPSISARDMSSQVLSTTSSLPPDPPTAQSLYATPTVPFSPSLPLPLLPVDLPWHPYRALQMQRLLQQHEDQHRGWGSAPSASCSPSAHQENKQASTLLAGLLYPVSLYRDSSRDNDRQDSGQKDARGQDRRSTAPARLSFGALQLADECCGRMQCLRDFHDRWRRHHSRLMRRRKEAEATQKAELEGNNSVDGLDIPDSTERRSQRRPWPAGYARGAGGGGGRLGSNVNSQQEEPLHRPGFQQAGTLRHGGGVQRAETPRHASLQHAETPHKGVRAHEAETPRLCKHLVRGSEATNTPDWCCTRQKLRQDHLCLSRWEG